MSANQNPNKDVSGPSIQESRPSDATPPPQQQKNNSASNATTFPISQKANTPPFTAYLQIVSLTATITVSVSISASQGFATGGSFFGITLTNDNDPVTSEAIRGTIASAKWLSWSAAVASCSLMITLVLQLLLTDELFVRHITQERGVLGPNVPWIIVGAGSWIALALQGSALALIGQALKIINPASGTMIQVNPLVQEFLDSALNFSLSGVYSLLDFRPSVFIYLFCTKSGCEAVALERKLFHSYSAAKAAAKFRFYSRLQISV